jgi:hypothetical protein
MNNGIIFQATRVISSKRLNNTGAQMVQAHGLLYRSGRLTVLILQ